MSPAAPKRETELYAPLKAWLEDHGYMVRSEVLGCDIAAQRGGALVLIEMKLRFGVELLTQAVARQRATPSVYVAIPRPERMAGKKWRDTMHLLRRLEIGLVVVTPRSAEVVFHPTPFARKQHKAQRRALLTEMKGRSADRNTGGSHGRKLVTAYREQALFIACCLDRFGPLPPKTLRAIGAGPKARAIVYDNHYGWFERLDKALYGIRPAGRDALTNYPELAAHFRATLPETLPDPARVR